MPEIDANGRPALGRGSFLRAAEPHSASSKIHSFILIERTLSLERNGVHPANGRNAKQNGGAALGLDAAIYRSYNR
jgi:hypothetical protein